VAPGFVAEGVVSGHGYGAYARGCRCEVCRAAKAAYMRSRRKQARRAARRQLSETGVSVIAGVTHGRAAYEERGCRCVECLDARALMWRVTYERKKETTS
jgi:hypothetical protein